MRTFQQIENIKRQPLNTQVVGIDKVKISGGSVVASSQILLPAGRGYPHTTTREQRAGMRAVA